MLVLSFGAAVAWADGSGILPPSVDHQRLDHLLETGTALMATVAGLGAMLRWKLAGEAQALRAGLAVILFGVATVGLGDLIPFLTHDQSQWATAVDPAGTIVAVVLLLGAARTPPVDTRLRPWRIGVLAAGSLVILTAGLALTPLADVAMNPAGRAALAVAWLATGSVFTALAIGSRRAHHASVASMAVALGLAEIAAAMAVSGETGTGVATFRALAMVLALVGGTREMECAFRRQREQLLESMLSAQTEIARRRAEHAAHEERAHDARNALMAIEGSTHTLERYRDRLTTEDRESLSRAVRLELTRLQGLIEAKRGDERCVRFEVARLLDPIATMERTRGVRVELDVAPELTAIGRSAEVAEVVRNLLDNARRYAPGSPIMLRAAREDGWVVIRVDDRGPGVRREERQSIFGRGRRGTASRGTDGSGLGLFIAKRMVETHHGRIWVTSEGIGKGSTFSFTIPVHQPNSVAANAA